MQHSQVANILLDKQNSIKYLFSGSSELLNGLKSCPPIKNLSTEQIEHLINNIHLIIEDETISRSQDLIIQIFKLLRNLAARGKYIQDKIISLPQFFTLVTQQIQSQHAFSETKLVIFQCLANLCVQNNEAQIKTWNNTNELLMQNLSIHSDYHNVAAIILYYIFIDNNNSFIHAHGNTIFKKLIDIIFDPNEKSDGTMEFVNIFIEYFLIKYEEIVELYKGLDIEVRINSVKYCIELVKADDHNRCLNKSLCVYLLNDFKKKSDYILNLRNANSSLEPREIIVILELITNLSARCLYTSILHTDKSLFLNIGCLLVSLHDLGKVSNNIFKPASKLEDFITSRDSTNSLENDISYEFKTMLIRCIANLSYKNLVNQNLARDLKILLTILECTNMDARNPLIKEWSILAIRNLCENNEQNQTLIKSLTKLGDKLSPVVVDDGRKDGSMRINLKNK